MTILGINAYHADASAAIYKDGVLVAAIEEERFRRKKHWAGFPAEAIAFCLREAEVTINQVDHITIGRNPNAKMLKKLLFLAKDPWGGIQNVRERLNNRNKISSLEYELAKHFHADSKVMASKLRRIEHHRSHMASAFFPSPFDEAAILSIDGSGDFTTTMIGVGQGTRIRVIDSIDFPVSCGLFYTAFTQFLGFPHYGDEYKVMGLAPYGKPVYLDQVRQVMRLQANGMFDWDPRFFRSAREVVITYGSDNMPVVGNLYSDHFTSVFGNPRSADEDLTQQHKDLAASVQRVTEEAIMHILSHLQKRTGLKKICVAGGVAQNSVANGKIIGATGFDELYVPPAGHDAGLSMGSALYQYHHVLRQPRSSPQYSAYTGSKFTNDDIEQVLKTNGISYKKYHDDELFEIVVDKLIEPGVVGWFSGRAEFGPRALGGRSILADPRNPRAKDLLNSKIKRRESFRPFAPSILKEFTSEYFEKAEEVPFMEKVFPIRSEKRERIPAVTHVDGSGRLQTVRQDVSPRYYSLISAFHKRTGIPILLNTSFNENEPIVNTPQEALDCYLRTQMDMLVLENCVVQR
ncbi:MAG TPA: carbamoyltransferase C-terminal domain-containing protein [Cyclobacteriaceae bacterium]|nr:carbamoyltransferase C-terminal domain-containing protein [Cyclobacteriaceae bacterium]